MSEQTNDPAANVTLWWCRRCDTRGIPNRLTHVCPDGWHIYGHDGKWSENEVWPPYYDERT